jgi:hypothetical protein
MIEHRYEWKSNRTDGKGCTSRLLFEKYGNENIKIELIEECEYTQRKEREQHYINLHKSINIKPVLPPTLEIKAEMQRGYVREYRKQKSNDVDCECGGHYKDYHKSAHLKSEMHKYFEETGEQLVREEGKSGTYIMCNCGSKVKFEHRCTHLRTDKHKRFVETGIKPNNCPCGGKYAEGGTGIYTHRQTERHRIWEYNNSVV